MKVLLWWPRIPPHSAAAALFSKMETRPAVLDVLGVSTPALEELVLSERYVSELT